jgi:peptidyl-prolyl cis-trans isomerase SurA
MKSTIGAALIVVTAVCLAPTRAEILEEIVAYVDSDVITKSEFDAEEQLLISEAYRQLAGEELDRILEERREGLLLSMIDRKILLHRAMRLYDMERMVEVYYEMFRRQQNIESEEEFEAVMARQGMTVADVKEQLVEMFAPDDVIRIEVGGRISVGDEQVQEYYEANPDRFTIEGEVTLREIVLLADTKDKKQQRRPEMEKILERLESEEFAEVARETSEAGTAAEGGLLGPLKKGDLAWQLEAMAFQQPVGEFGVLETSYGYHLLKVESRSEDGLKPLDEVREQVRTYLENELYLTKLNEFMDKARAESEWCVKDKYMNRLPPKSPRRPCSSL